jgi:hypothetical protein
MRAFFFAYASGHSARKPDIRIAAAIPTQRQVTRRPAL